MKKHMLSAVVVVVALVAPILVCPASGFAQKLDVKIIDRQENETEYTYVVPGHSVVHSNSNAYCNGDADDVNCNGSTTTTGSSTPSQQVSYHVRGATFSLQLPDGRVAVVNCESKSKPANRVLFGSEANVNRDCRTPLVDNIQAEFHGDNAKLEWVVSLDGKKIQSETYKVLAVLEEPKNEESASVPKN